jgi:hypothetical protein
VQKTRLRILCSALYSLHRSAEDPADRSRKKGWAMVKSLEELQKFGKENVEATLKSFDAYARNIQSIAQEVADYSKKSLDEGARTAEKLFGAKSFENAIEIQNAYLKSAYEGFISEATKLGSLYVDLARETYRPFESQFAKATGTK